MEVDYISSNLISWQPVRNKKSKFFFFFFFLNIFMQDCCFSFKKKTAINAGPVKN